MTVFTSMSKLSPRNPPPVPPLSSLKNTPISPPLPIDDEIDNNNSGDDDEDDEEEDDPFRDPPQGHLRLRPSNFRGIPATVFVEYPPELKIKRIDKSSIEPMGKRSLCYRSHWERICIRNAFRRAGFAKVEGGHRWTAMW